MNCTAALSPLPARRTLGITTDNRQGTDARGQIGVQRLHSIEQNFPSQRLTVRRDLRGRTLNVPMQKIEIPQKSAVFDGSPEQNMGFQGPNLGPNAPMKKDLRFARKSLFYQE